MKIRSTAIGIVLAGLVTAQTAEACSFLNFRHDGGMYTGRTNELPFETDEQMIVVPRGYNFQGIEVTHGFVGITHGDDRLVSSGFNEHGVNVEALGYGIEGFAAEGEGDVKMLDFPQMVLANARSVDEAVELIKNWRVEGEQFGQFAVPVGFHFAITDNQKSVVVEFDAGDGTANVYENIYGVMTNTPAYPEQLELAEAMADSVPDDPDDYEGTFFGFDRTPEGRFQQIFATNALRDMSRSTTDFDYVNQAWAAVNALEIPQGTLYWRFLSNEPQMTAYAVVIDIKNMDYYLRTHDNQTIRKIDVDAIDFATVDFQSADIYRTASDYQPFEF